MIDQKANPWPKYPTPLHIYWGNRVREDAKVITTEIQRHLPEARFFYSVKTNPLPALLRQLHDIGWGMEVVNPADFALVRRIRSRNIIVNSILPDEDAYRRMLTSSRTAALHVESLDAATAVASAAKWASSRRLGFLAPKPRARVGLRINDRNSHFGIPLNRDALAEVSSRLRSSGISISSLHIHRNYDGGTATAEKYKNGFLQNLGLLIEAKKILAEAGGDQIMSFDLGGGIDHPELYRVPPEELGVYHSGKLKRPEPKNTLGEIASEVGACISTRLKQEGLEHLEIFFEFGRTVATRALDTLLTVSVVKRDLYPNATIATTNGSTAFLGPIHRALHPIEAEIDSEAREKTFLYGKLPHSADWLAQNIDLPILSPGDNIRIKYTGAYFLPLEARFGNTLPAIVDGNTGQILRRGEKISDAIAHYC